MDLEIFLLKQVLLAGRAPNLSTFAVTILKELTASVAETDVFVKESPVMQS